MADNFAEIWDSLAQRPRDGGYVQRAIFTAAKLDLYLGLEANNTRFFIFAARRAAIAELRTPVSSAGIEIRKLERPDYGEKIVYRLALTDPAYVEFFDKVIEDVCRRASAHDTESGAYAATINRISEWQRFFAKNALGGMSEEARRGLYGELSFIRELTQENALNVSGLACWRGPFGADQDFQFPEGAVEVKVSISAQNQEIIISSERQLDGRNYAHLYLYHLALSIRRNSGETLNQLVDSVRQTIPAHLSEDFERGLLEVGYLDAQRDLYSEDGYVVRETNYFEVRDNFPRITETDLQKVPGVGKVRYAISVPVCKSFAVPRENLFNLLRGMSRG